MIDFKKLLHPSRINKIKEEFKRQDILFNQRYNIIDNGYKNNLTFDPRTICKIDINYSSRLLFKKLTNILPITKSYQSIKFDYVFNMSSKYTYNGSDPNTLSKLTNALKYQLIGNHELFKDLSIQEIANISILYMDYFMQNVNNSITYNNNDSISYDPVYSSKINNIILLVCEQIYENKDYYVQTLNGQNILLDIDYIKSNCIEMKKFTEDEFRKLLSDATEYYGGELPTLIQVANYYNNEVISIDDYNDILDYENASVYRRMLLYYVDLYNCRELVKIRNKKPKLEKEN